MSIGRGKRSGGMVMVVSSGSGAAEGAGMAEAKQPWQDIWLTARDGLKLYGRHYPAPGSPRRPLLCLAGLTRNSRDFHDIALALSTTELDTRPVYTLDYRGRGSSQHDADWRNYAIPIEMLDVQDFMTTHGLHDTAILGTSRGGLVTMLLAAVQPSLVGAVILNDIGPVIERSGLARIAGYVARVPLPGSWEHAAEMVADMSRSQFPAVRDRQWVELARQIYNEKDGRPAPGYDAKLGKALSVLDGPVPALWPQFEALKRAPLMVLRGETSDILSVETVEEMRRRHPNCVAVSVEGQGHAPLLKDLASIRAIRRFLAAADQGVRVTELALV